MADPNIADNPFAALFGSVDQAAQFKASTIKTQDSASASCLSPKANEVESSNSNDSQLQLFEEGVSIEQVFLITFDPGAERSRPPCCVHLEDLCQSLKGQLWMSADILEQAVFERLMLADPDDHVILTCTLPPDAKTLAAAGEKNPLQYLYACFKRLQSNKKSAISSECERVILMNSRSCFQHPEIFAIENFSHQMLDIYLEEFDSADAEVMMVFFELVAGEVHAHNDEGTLLECFLPLLNLISSKLQKDITLCHTALFRYVNTFFLFSRKSCLAETFLQYIWPKDVTKGRAFEQTLLGTALSFSCLTTSENGPASQFFDRPSRTTKQEIEITESRIHQPTSNLNETVYQLIFNILKLGGECRQRMLNWIGSCLMANKGRAKIWTNQMPGMLSQMYCSDGFFVNLCAVMLRLCKPFSVPQSPKLLKIQHTYCLATNGSAEVIKARNVHINGLDETGLVPHPEGENEQPTSENSYNFISESFFLTHYTLHLGIHVVQERFLKLNQDLHRVEGAYRDIVAQGGESTEMAQRVKDQVDKGMTLFLCLKAALLEPELIRHMLDFHVATATYLIHTSTAESHSSFNDLSFPLDDNVPRDLACIPELIAENVLDFLMFLRRFKDEVFELSSDCLPHLMDFVLVFMGSPSRMRNPHLRARLAEALEAMMPPQNTQNRSSLISHYKREQLFEQHPHIHHLGATLLHVFVSIEMTGQGVEFEQKFNYRRPMYSILEYIWNVNIHQEAIKKLAVHAEGHMEDVDAPLFLRFINLLINDAIFLLDEALSYMQQLKEKQEERDTGRAAEAASAVEGRAGASAEEPATPRQRQQQDADFRHMSMLARFHNIMSNDTIHTLEYITRDIKSIFCHKTLVDRMANMLNYFLVHLVGSKQKNFKVKDFSEFEFKPQELVSHICDIYLNLGESSTAFCEAVHKDGRSYSPELFPKATRVMEKIMRPVATITKFMELGQQIQAMNVVAEAAEEALGDVPEEFLDPIMGTLMMQPVLLPSSGNIVDRTTIARHILSDQSDPFNRQPLTMEQVEPQTDLQQRINQWLTGNKKS